MKLFQKAKEKYENYLEKREQKLEKLRRELRAAKFKNYYNEDVSQLQFNEDERDDVYKFLISFIHKHGLEYYSYERMNDSHFFFNDYTLFHNKNGISANFTFDKSPLKIYIDSKGFKKFSKNNSLRSSTLCKAYANYKLSKLITGNEIFGTKIKLSGGTLLHSIDRERNQIFYRYDRLYFDFTKIKG